MKEYLEELKKQGIHITDNRKLGLGFVIENENYNYISLNYRNNLFHINTKGCWLSPEQAKVYATELTNMILIVEKLNSLLKA